MDDEFMLEQALAAQRALRKSLDLPDETFPMPAFFGMISDEIEQHCKTGKSDQDIADVICAATGKSVDPDTIKAFYAPPEQRQAR